MSFVQSSRLLDSETGVLVSISFPKTNIVRRRVASRVKRQVLRSVESLEVRALMTASLVRDINLSGTEPTNITDVGGTAFYTAMGDPQRGLPGLYSDGAASSTDQLLSTFP